jgi:hypothetical protein
MASETAPAAAPLRVILSYAVPVTGAILVSSWSALVAIFRFCLNVVVAVVQPLLAILQVLFAPILFLLSPLVHVARVVWDVTLCKPYALIGVAAAELYDICRIPERLGVPVPVPVPCKFTLARETEP